jgi:hypothetical protein
MKVRALGGDWVGIGYDITYLHLAPLKVEGASIPYDPLAGGATLVVGPWQGMRYLEPAPD